MEEARKKALVTGASGAIGGAICARLAAQGFHVIAHAYRNLEAVEQLVDELRRKGRSAESISFDVADYDEAEGKIIPLVDKKPVQVLVHNAGIHDDAPLAGMRLEQWQSVVNTSLNGFFNVTRPLLLPMITTRWGRVIAISSVAGVLGNRGQANYAAAKAGLHGAVKSLAHEVASRGITVNAIAPGVIDTPMSAEQFDKAMIKRMVPAQRAGRPDEVAALAGFLCSDDAAYITGQVISINGGIA